MEPIVLLTVRDVPALRLRRLDRVVFDLAVSHLPCRVRGPFVTVIPNTGAVLGAFMTGALLALTDFPLEQLVSLAG